MREQESNIIAQQLLEIERTKNDSTRMFHAIKQMQHLKPKARLLINTNEGALTENEKEQTQLISQHFKQQFFKNQEIIPTIPPTPVTKPFAKEEIKNTIKYLKNNKSKGNDGVKSELLKHAPEIVYTEIAEILNETAKSGDFPKELTQGILTTIQKPEKTKGPITNLRPITLLSMLRKILGSCMKQRIIDRIDREIPPSQAA